MWLERLRRSEEGQALVAGISITFVMAVVIASLLAIWRHGDDATARDRSQAQGIQSAEAAVSMMIDSMSRSLCVPDLGLAAPQTLSVDGRAVGQYRAIVRLPQEAGMLNPTMWNPNDPVCQISPPPATGERVITAWGYGPSADAARPVVRKLEVVVRVSALTGFRYTCFAGGSSPGGVITLGNNANMAGDCYARSLVNANNNFDFTGVLTTPGLVSTRNNTTYDGSIWAGGDVTVGNNTVIGGWIASVETVNLGGGSKVLGNVTADNITYGSGAMVDGSRCPPSVGAPGCPVNMPPTLQMPVLSCGPSDQGCWAAMYPGMQVRTAAQMTSWLTANASNLQGTFYVNDPNNVISFRNGGTVTGPLTILTTGRIELGGRLEGSPSATAPGGVCNQGDGPTSCQVVLVSMNSAADAIHVRPPRFEATPNVSMLLYTTGALLAENGANPFTYHGVMYARTLNLNSNKMNFTHSADLANYPPPFVDWHQSTAATTDFVITPEQWREMPPELP